MSACGHTNELMMPCIDCAHVEANALEASPYNPRCGCKPCRAKRPSMGPATMADVVMPQQPYVAGEDREEIP